uniref:hypothetical protein n=1 Tax=uncultured Adlercreutzia sp. TaxID=875803 RepID=UPI00266BA75A
DSVTSDKLAQSVRDSLSQAKTVRAYGKVDQALFYVTDDGNAAVEVLDKDGGRHYILGNS